MTLSINLVYKKLLVSYITNKCPIQAFQVVLFIIAFYLDDDDIATEHTSSAAPFDVEIKQVTLT